MISKELLSEVLGIGVYQSIRKDEYAYNDVKLNIINTELLYNYVNIYELAHNCKLWAFANGYYLTIYNDAIDVVLQSNCKILENVTNDNFMYDPNLVFKACQWILDNKGNK